MSASVPVVPADSPVVPAGISTIPAGIPADLPADIPADIPAGPAIPNGVVDAFYLLQNAEALYQSRLRDRLQLGANELAAMRYINRLQTLGHDVRAMDVTQSLGVTSGATSVILSHLVARGYLTRTVNPRDGRGKLLHLTEAATIAVSHTLDDTESDLSQLVSGLSAQDSERVVGLLAAVTSVLEQSGHAEP